MGRQNLPKKLLLCTLLLLVIFGLVYSALPMALERYFNKISATEYPEVSSHAIKLHKSLTIVDLHADSLLWNRNLLIRNDIGHVDIPRMIEGNVALQAFTIVTKVPKNLQLEKNTATSDDITLLAVAERWPAQTWSKLKERTIYQCQKLQKYASSSNGKFFLIQSSEDLRNYLKHRETDPGCTAGFLGVEGAHALDGNLENIDLFYKNGIRMMAPTHFFDNDIGASAHGMHDTGLTAKGKDMVRLMQERHMLVDLAHASKQVIYDTVHMAKRPVVVSHTGVKGVCDNARNLSDDQLRAIAKTGGLVGIGFWPTAVCGSDAKAIAKSIKYTANVIGVDHVALGSDFDGTVTTPFDAAHLVLLTQALIDEGFSDEEIHQIMGANAVKLLLSELPAQ